ncbi:MAG: exonuclease [Dehalococcoidia bacterium]|nr:exonuclease [Dehalococcoidia bacterium]
MPSYLEAYLDIETTGLSPRQCQITVVGVHLCRGKDSRFVQLVGEDISADSLLEVLEGVEVIYTYNGSRFDLPFIHRRLGVNLAEMFEHYDLMYDCWRNNLRGGFKAVERQLGIPRRLAEMNGSDAVRLWWRYVNGYDRRALAVLLEYNREDVINLKALREKLSWL